MKIKKTVKQVGIALLILLALHLSLRYWGLVLFPKSRKPGWSQDYSTYYFSTEKRNTVDQVFIGSSHQFCSVDVNILNHDYGMNSILLSSSGQDLNFSYYSVMEALELQNPSRIVLETSTATADKKEYTVLSAEYFLDNMPNWTRTKFECIKSLDNVPCYYHYYPITVLHNQWSEIRWKDLLLPERLPKGERYVYDYSFVTDLGEIELVPCEDKLPLSDFTVETLTKII